MKKINLNTVKEYVEKIALPAIKDAAKKATHFTKEKYAQYSTALKNRRLENAKIKQQRLDTTQQQQQNIEKALNLLGESQNLPENDRENLTQLLETIKNTQLPKSNWDKTAGFLIGLGKTLNGAGQVISYLPNKAAEGLKTTATMVAIPLGITLSGNWILNEKSPIETVDDITKSLEENGGIVPIFKDFTAATINMFAAAKFPDIATEISTVIAAAKAGPNCTAEDFKNLEKRTSYHEFNQVSCKWDFDQESFLKDMCDKHDSESTDPHEYNPCEELEKFQKNKSLPTPSLSAEPTL